MATSFFRLDFVRVGLPAFFIVLLTMPLGHTLMVLNEKLLGPAYKFPGATVLGLLGTVLLLAGIRANNNRSKATILGLLAGILIWTGWVEFSFVWIAQKQNVQALMEGDEVVTKPEYLIMLSSIGLLGTMILFFGLSKTNCTFFRWFQKKLSLQTAEQKEEKSKKPFALTTMIEVSVITWAFYILLLLIYDKDILGDRHPVTFLVAIGSLLWSVWLFMKLMLIKKFDYAIRYAVPTVIIFWNFIEIIGRWGLMKEIWVHPMDYWMPMTAVFMIFIGFLIYFFIAIRKHQFNAPEDGSAA